MQINHTWGSDVTLSATGDLALVSGDEAVLQRLLRLLMTNSAITGEVEGDYPAQQSYGASIRRQVGQTRDLQAIESAVMAQLMADADVAPTPQPTVTVRPFSGGVQCSLKFTSAATGTRQILEFSV